MNIEWLPMRKMILISVLLLATLPGGAKTALPDSLLSFEKAYTCNLTSPDTAFAIVQTMRERKMAPEWRLDIVEGDLNYNIRRFLRAQPFYERTLANESLRDSNQVQLDVLKRLMDVCDLLSEDDALMEYIFRLRQKARSCGNKEFIAMADFMEGKRTHYHGNKSEGYELCLKALEAMKASDYRRKHSELRVFYAELIKMYARDGRYDEALQMSKLQEAEARESSTFSIQRAGDRAMRRVYALRASMLAQAGRRAAADRAYAQWLKTTGGNVMDDLDIFDYLRLTQHNTEALDVIKRYREFIQSQGDTISYRMMTALNKEALIHLACGEFDLAAEHGREVARIADSLHLRVSNIKMDMTNKLLMEEMERHRSQLWNTIVFALLLGLLLLLGVAVYYTRKIRRKNTHLIRLLNAIDAYRKAVINGASPTSPEIVEALEAIRSYENEEISPDEVVDEPDDEDRRLFIEMDTQVTRDRLFLKPGFCREDLIRLIGVDKNRFGKMMSKYSTNASVYINMRRVEYGAKLLIEQPTYTIATIALECGMGNTVTFNRTFKEVYSMTPSEYRETMGAILPKGGGKN